MNRVEKTKHIIVKNWINIRTNKFWEDTYKQIKLNHKETVILSQFYLLEFYWNEKVYIIIMLCNKNLMVRFIEYHILIIKFHWHIKYTISIHLYINPPNTWSEKLYIYLFFIAHKIINQPTMFTHLLTKENLLNNLS